jgi:hypothetical protein
LCDEIDVMNLNTPPEEQPPTLTTGSLHAFAHEHKRELETVTNILAEITHRTPAQVESHLETLLNGLMEDDKKPNSSGERVRAFQEWVDSHKGMNFPAFVDDSRESIYGERG